ncbi:MAG: glycosyltransferase family 2 protein [candidate division WOR-3 bacterium]
MKASVIVVTFNRAPILVHCIDKLLNQSVDDYEVIVVDDGSTDGTEDLIKKIDDKRVLYLKNEKNMGQPFSRNRGIKIANGEVIIFVDSDVLVHKNFVEDHLKIHERNDKLIVQGLVRHIRDIKDYNKMNLKIDGLCLSGLVTQNVSVRRKWLLEVGGLDESFGTIMGYEDIELGRRLKGIGLKTVYSWRRCLAWHMDGRETDERLESVFNKAFMFGRNAVKFSRMYGKKVAMRHLKKNYVFFINKILGTEYWVEKKGLNYLKTHKNGFSYPILKWIIKYYYRGKGIKEALKEEGSIYDY